MQNIQIFQNQNDNEASLKLSEIMLRKLIILKQFGFQDNSPTVIQTLKNTEKRDSIEKYRTKCF